MKENLAEMECVPCKEGALALKQPEIQGYCERLHQEWKVINRHHLERELTFPDFRTALDFTNRVGEVAEAQGHHPDIYLSWGKLRLTLWTHKVDGLTRSDFVLAAKVDRL